jgi:hypothetical protein
VQAREDPSLEVRVARDEELHEPAQDHVVQHEADDEHSPDEDRSRERSSAELSLDPVAELVQEGLHRAARSYGSALRSALRSVTGSREFLRS